MGSFGPEKFDSKFRKFLFGFRIKSREGVETAPKMLGASEAMLVRRTSLRCPQVQDRLIRAYMTSGTLTHLNLSRFQKMVKASLLVGRVKCLVA